MMTKRTILKTGVKVTIDDIMAVAGVGAFLTGYALTKGITDIEIPDFGISEAVERVTKAASSGSNAKGLPDLGVTEKITELFT